jgi:hypothetical protein
MLSGALLTAKQIAVRAGFASMTVLHAILSQMVRAGSAKRCGTRPQTYSPLAEPRQPGAGPRRSVMKLQIATVRAALAGDAAARAEVERAIGGEA